MGLSLRKYVLPPASSLKFFFFFFFRFQTELPLRFSRSESLPHPFNCLPMSALYVSAFGRIADDPTVCVAVLASSWKKRSQRVWTVRVFPE